MTPKTPCPQDAMTNEKKEGIELSTPRTKTCSKDASNTPREIGST